MKIVELEAIISYLNRWQWQITFYLGNNPLSLQLPFTTYLTREHLNTFIYVWV